MHKVFISHHHSNDQGHKDSLVKIAEEHGIFVDMSVDTGDISDDLKDETIREMIRDQYLMDSTVTILLVGTETKNRKHIDWEIYSSMIDGRLNKKSGILVVNLPSVDNSSASVGHGDREKEIVYPDVPSWQQWSTRDEYEAHFPYMPSRIIDNLVSGAKISVVGWDRLNVERLKFLVEATYSDRHRCDYDLSAPMRRRNS